jgi:hypothetical protein
MTAAAHPASPPPRAAAQATFPLGTYLLFLVLMTLLGLLTVHEAVGRTETRYRAAALLAKEERLLQDLARLRAETTALSAPARLERLNAEAGLGLVPLAPAVERAEARPAPAGE